MEKSTKVLVIGNPHGLVTDELWASFSSQFHVHTYDFLTLDDFHQSMQSGQCKDIQAIVRLGINIPEGIEKVTQGWTRRSLPYFPPSLRLIVNFGHGYDEEDIPGLQARGISFKNTTGGSESTAAVGTYLILATFRQFGLYERMLREGKFLPALRHSARHAVDVFGKALGVVGMGSIGQLVAKQAAALGMKIHCINRPSLRQALDASFSQAHGLELMLHEDLESLVANVDCVILTCSYSPETHHILSRSILEKMRPGSRVINIARGKCVDEEALCDALDNGVISGIGMDVHYNEPTVNPRLLKHDHVTLLPHVGGLTHDSMSNHAMMALQAASEFFHF